MPAFGVVRRRRSVVWERGESKIANEIDVWGMCSARALARRGRRPLQRALHRDGEVAAARMVLGSAGRVARSGRLQREATGGGGAPERRVDASAKQQMAGKALHGAGVGALHGGGEKQSREVGEGDKGQFKISKTSRDYSVNKQ